MASRDDEYDYLFKGNESIFFFQLLQSIVAPLDIKNVFSYIWFKCWFESRLISMKHDMS